MGFILLEGGFDINIGYMAIFEIYRNNFRLHTMCMIEGINEKFGENHVESFSCLIRGTN